MKTALTIAGSDCSGGAGIQADLKTFSAHGVFGMSVIVSVVAENTSRVIDILEVSPSMIEKQIDAVFEDIPVDAVKIGMLGSAPSMVAVSNKLKEWKPHHVVVDPVMYAKNGCPLMEPNAIDTLISTVLPHADLLTPNLPEAECISGMEIATMEDTYEAARRIHAMGPKAVLIKGGHRQSQGAIDILYDGSTFTPYTAPRIHTKNTHGTGCTLSSAIASNLALGHSLDKAVQLAKDYVTCAISHALPLGKGCGPTHHFYELYQRSGMSDAL